MATNLLFIQEALTKVLKEDTSASDLHKVAETLETASQHLIQTATNADINLAESAGYLRQADTKSSTAISATVAPSARNNNTVASTVMQTLKSGTENIVQPPSESNRLVTRGAASQAVALPTVPIESPIRPVVDTRMPGAVLHPAIAHPATSTPLSVGGIYTQHMQPTGYPTYTGQPAAFRLTRPHLHFNRCSQLIGPSYLNQPSTLQPVGFNPFNPYPFSFPWQWFNPSFPPFVPQGLAPVDTINNING
jgi:hypothetical protein